MAQTQKPEKITLQVTPRTILGKANRSHRKQGFLPGNIYGKDFASTAISIDAKTFIDTFKQAGETSVVYIHLEGKDIPTLISDIDYHPVTENILHIDFRKVNMKQKIEAQVPFVFVGESHAVEKENGVLLTQTEHATVSALPADIPSEIEIDLSKLLQIGDTIRISDLTSTGGYEVTDDPDKTIVSVTEHKEEEIEPEITSEEPEILGDGEGTEGESEEGKEASADKQKKEKKEEEK